MQHNASGSVNDPTGIRHGSSPREDNLIKNVRQHMKTEKKFRVAMDSQWVTHTLFPKGAQ